MKKLFIIFALTIFVSSCAKQEDFSFEGIENVAIESLSLAGAVVSGDIVVSNGSRKNLTVEDLELSIMLGTMQVATGALDEAVVFAKRSSEARRVSLSFKPSANLNPLVLLTLSSKIDQITIEGQAKFKLGVVSRTVELPKVRVADFMDNLDLGI